MVALFYYDKPLLEAWLNHYVQFGCIDEILIQNQNWSDKATLYLLKTVAKYVDRYNKKIVVLPSNYKSFRKDPKQQFKHYGQPKIRNRVQRFLKGSTWILGSIDVAIYGKNYADTNVKLAKFERAANKRAKKGLNTIGFLPYYCVYYDGFHPCYGLPIIKGQPPPMWRHRIFRFAYPFANRGDKVHDNSFDVKKGGKWRRATPVGACLENKIKRWDGLKLDLRILHYHTLIKASSGDSAKHVKVVKRKVKHIRNHPKYYFNKLPKK